jgi:hypothetical protein
VTQAPDRGRHPRGCRPRRRFCGAQVARRGRRLPDVAAGFQPAGSPGPGWFMCRLKTCTHVKATSCMPAESGRISADVAAGFQPAGSPGPGWFMCRLKTCTHVRATSCMPAGSGRRLPEVAAGFQPAGSPGPGWFMCRLKTCTHVKATSCMPAERKRCQPPKLGNPDCERSLAPARRGPGSGRPDDRKNVTQAPDRGRHPPGCRPRRRFCGARNLVSLPLRGFTLEYTPALPPRSLGPQRKHNVFHQSPAGHPQLLDRHPQAVEQANVGGRASILHRIVVVEHFL